MSICLKYYCERSFQKVGSSALACTTLFPLVPPAKPLPVGGLGLSYLGLAAGVVSGFACFFFFCIISSDLGSIKKEAGRLTSLLLREVVVEV